jgi:hypothetical protein
MKKSFAEIGRQQGRPGGQGVVEDDGSEHGRVEQSRKVVVEVQDATHGPEGDVVQGPADEEPETGVHGSIAALLDFGLFVVTWNLKRSLYDFNHNTLTYCFTTSYLYFGKEKGLMFSDKVSF